MNTIKLEGKPKGGKYLLTVKVPDGDTLEVHIPAATDYKHTPLGKYVILSAYKVN